MASTTADHALVFPASLPNDTEVEVPFPANSHPWWTAEPYAGMGLPATFDNFLTLPSPSQEPAYYAAAADCVRMTNWFFGVTGTYNPLAPLTEEHVQHLIRRWPSRINARGRRVKLAPAEHFPLPPDGRMLFVKEGMGDCTDNSVPVVWVAACKSVARMSDAEWERCLGLSRDQLIAQSEARFGGDDSWLVKEIFKRYLVWRELVHGVSERAKAFADEQPSAEQLEEFFEKEEFKTKGATLVDLCHAFPHARNPQMLVYRVEHFATLTEQPSVPTALGVEDPVESRYIRKPDPTKRAIKTALSALLLEPGNSVDFLELGEEYFLSSANRQLILNVLASRTARDVTTGRYIKAGTSPDTPELCNTMAQLDFANGFTLTELAARFPYRVSSLNTLLQSIKEFTYHDEDEQLYFPLFPTAEGHFTSVDESLVQRTQMRIILFDPHGALDAATIENEHDWDRVTMRYMPREEGLDELDDSDEMRSLPSTIGLDDSPALKVVNSMQLNVASVETVPVEPSVPGNVLLSVIVTAAESVPVEPSTSAPNLALAPAPVPALASAPAAAGTPAVAAAPAPISAETAKRGRGRTPKRKAIEPTESPRGTKKARKVLKIRCAGTTQKGTRCKRQKDGDEGDDEWRCVTHRE
ncbi:hypothetical protein SVAN01_02576 [Stagonosporopsis vannaccii]|nr:hypothetical protein SVAN01_02576 [Stagonosporopsis vannaccii]